MASGPPLAALDEGRRFGTRQISVRERSGEVHAYLLPEDYRRLRLEASARGVSRSRCAGDCLAEYFAQRQEMATALDVEVPEQLENLAPSRVIHVLLAQTEQRLVATFERYVEDLVAVREGVDALLAMADRSHFTAPFSCTRSIRGAPVIFPELVRGEGCRRSAAGARPCRLGLSRNGPFGLAPSAPSS